MPCNRRFDQIYARLAAANSSINTASFSVAATLMALYSDARMPPTELEERQRAGPPSGYKGKGSAQSISHSSPRSACRGLSGPCRDVPVSLQLHEPLGLSLLQKQCLQGITGGSAGIACGTRGRRDGQDRETLRTEEGKEMHTPNPDNPWEAGHHACPTL